MVVYANHADFSEMGEVWHPSVKSRLCLWSKGGRGQVVINGKNIALRRGDYLLLPWSASIRYQPDQKSPFILAGIHLIPDFDATSDPMEYQAAHHPDHPLSFLCSRNDAPIPGLEGLVRYHVQLDDPLLLLSETIVAHFISESRCEHQLRSLASVLTHELSQARNIQSLPPKLRELLVELDDHLSKPVTVGDLADRLDLSDSQVRRLFRRWLKTSPTEYLAKKRMDKASALLTSTRMSIEQIANQVGYEDPFYFSRVFKKLRGVPPSSHRRDTGFL